MILLGIGCALIAKPSPVFPAPTAKSERLIASEISGSATTSTQVETNATEPEQVDITGGETAGTNLFHQFGQFDLSENATARFLTDSDIQNVIGHIISGELSIIDGNLEILDSTTLGYSEANLYLINPAGILFGPNIRLNILGDFTATTATAIEFDQAVLSLSPSPLSTDYSEFLGNPTGFLFNGSGPIANLGTLQVEAGKVISLLGSTLLNLGNINAPGGGIRLSAIEDQTIVRINQANHLLALEISVDNLSPQNGSTQSKTVAELLTGGNTDIAQYLQIDDGGVRLIRSPEIDIIIPNNSNSVINSGVLSVASENAEGGTIDLFGTQIGILGGEVDASGRNGGTIRVGSESSAERATANIYTDSKANLRARAESVVATQNPNEPSNGGQIIFRENNNGQDRIYFSQSGYVTQIYGDLDVRSLAPGGDGGRITLHSAGKATTYLADTHLEANSGQSGNITFEALGIEISDTPPSAYINENSLFAKSSDINSFIGGDTFRLPQATIQNFQNVTLESLHEIVLKDLANNKLEFLENSTVRFFSDRDSFGGGPFEMRDVGQTLVAPNGNVTIQSGRTADLTIRNIVTRPTNSEPSVNDGRDRIQIIGNKINLLGGAEGDGRQSLNTRILTVNSASPEVGIPRRGIQIGDSINNSEGAFLGFDPLRLNSYIMDALIDSASLLKIGDEDTGGILFSNSALATFRNSVELRSQSAIKVQTPLEAINNASLTFIAKGDIETAAIAASGNISFESTAGSITTAQINVLPALNETIGSVSLVSPNGDIKTGPIQVQSSPQNAGGDIKLTAGGTLFAASAVSADGTLGPSIRTDSGQVTIQHGTDSAFSIGSSTANGAAGEIRSAEDSLNDIAILGSYDEGKKLKISGPVEDLPPLEEPAPVGEIPTEETPPKETNVPKEVVVSEPIISEPNVLEPLLAQLPERTLENASKLEKADNPLSIPVEQRSEAAIATALFNQLEEESTAQFQAYLSSSDPVGIATISDVQNTLAQVTQASQQKPGLIYIYYRPNAAHAEAVRPSVSQQNRPDDELEVLLVTAEGTPIRKRQWGVTRDQVNQVATEFRRQATSQFSTPRDYLPPAQQLHQWMIASIEKEIEQQGITNLSFIMDDGLRTIPIAALHDGQNFLVEKYSIGLMPTFSLTEVDLTDRQSEKHDPRVLAMGASRFEAQAPLPAVESELALISKGLWLGNAFLNERFTLDNLKSQIASHQYDVLHLATHAFFKSDSIDQSYIQLWNDQLSLTDISTLGLSQSDIDLITLSACSTALGDRNSEYGFAGLAVSAGSQSALASLWPVSDEGTLGFMTQFYQYLPTANLRSEALRAAQLNMLQGKVGIDQGQIYGPNTARTTIPQLVQSGSWDFSHPFYWSAFTIIGSPW